MGAIAMTAVVCAVWLGLVQRSRTLSALENAEAQLATVRQQTEMIRVLSQRRGAVDAKPRPKTDIVEPLRTLMQQHGIAPDALTQVNLLSPQPIPQTPYERQQAALTFQSMRVPDLVRVLTQWRDREPLWLVRSIRLEGNPQPSDINPSAGETTRAPVAPDDRFTASIVLENIHLAQREPGRLAPPRP